MSAHSDKSASIGEIELLQSPDLPMTADAILRDFEDDPTSNGRKN